MKSILISRADNLGDVVLTLPLAGFLKAAYPGVHITWIGQPYTKPLVAACQHVDAFLEKEAVIQNPDLLAKTNADAILHVFPDKGIAEAAKKAKIPLRIGTSHRWYHILTCNKRVNFSRKQSNLHEAVLNFKLLEPLATPGLTRVLEAPAQNLARYYGINRTQALHVGLAEVLDSGKFNLVFHPKSRGSAREWPLTFYRALVLSLPTEQVQIIVTGTEAEGKAMAAEDPQFLGLPGVLNLCGKLSLPELITFLGKVDGLLACSTGPLHIAAAQGRRVLGLYPPIRPMHAGRWAPIGENASFKVFDKPDCIDCRGGGTCRCIQSIGPQEVYEHLMGWIRSQPKASM